jgi:hypothetical protein
VDRQFGENQTFVGYTCELLLPTRFAAFRLPENTGPGEGSLQVTFLLNFFDEVRRRMPLGSR